VKKQQHLMNQSSPEVYPLPSLRLSPREHSDLRLMAALRAKHLRLGSIIGIPPEAVKPGN